MDIKKYITISEGNSKLGKVANISLPPIETCMENPPCAKDCYPKVYLNRWPMISKVYKKNLSTYKRDPELYFNCISLGLSKMKPEYFRWHVAGDIPDLHYFNQMYVMAIVFPEIKFMVFTKKYKFLEYQKFSVKEYATNLTVIQSAWPGLALPFIECNHKRESEFPIAFLEEDTRRHNYLKCDAPCDSCGKCWDLNNLRKNVCLKRI